MRNSFYTNRRKLIDKKSSDLPDLGINAESKVYISESLTRYKKELFGEVNKLRKKIRWKHIWTQNSRIYVKESDKSTVVVIDSHEALDKFKIFDDACKQKGFSIFHCNIRSLEKNKS